MAFKDRLAADQVAAEESKQQIERDRQEAITRQRGFLKEAFDAISAEGPTDLGLSISEEQGRIKLQGSDRLIIIDVDSAKHYSMRTLKPKGPAGEIIQTSQKRSLEFSGVLDYIYQWARVDLRRVR